MAPTNGSVLCGCGRLMRVAKNGVTVEEVDGDGKPYKLWDADRYVCPACGVEIITGFGHAPLAEAWQLTYPAMRARLEPVIIARCR